MSSHAANRLLRLLSLLSARPHWSAAELAEQLDVTTRTVRRDIADLRDLGYPVESDPGRTGGYRLGIGGRLPPLLLTDDEAVVVAIGLRTSLVRGVTVLGDAAEAALAKLEQVLPPVLRDQVTALHDATVVVERPAGPAVDADALLTIARGVRGHRLVTFGYRSGEGAETERRVEPYGLVNAARRWYLVAYDLLRADWRTFRVDRARSVELTGHGFAPRPAPDTAALVQRAIASYPYDVQAELLLDLPFAEAPTEIPPTVGTTEPHDDGRRTRLRIGADDLAWIARYVASLPVDVEVVAPAALRDELRALGEQLVARHGTEVT